MVASSSQLRRMPGLRVARPEERAEPASDIRVELAASLEEFADLAPAWNELHEHAEAASIFNSWMWLYEWWRGYGAGRELCILVARHEGAIVGVLPLCRERTRVAGMRVVLARFIGTGGDTAPDDLGPVLAPGVETMAALALARAALRVPGVDVGLFSDVDPRSAFPKALETAARELGHSTLRAGGERIAWLELPRTWDAFLKSLSRDRRWRLRRSRRRLGEAHRSRFFVWDDAATLDAAIDRLAHLHRLRREQAGETGAFRSDAYLRFHRSVIHSLFARRCLRLYCLEVDGEIGAMLYCYRFRNRIYLMQAGFDPSLGRFGVGNVLLGYALEHAVGEGNDAWDFLRGEHRYKEELATAHRETVCLRAFASTPGGLAYRARRIWLPRLKARLLGRAQPALKP